MKLKIEGPIRSDQKDWFEKEAADYIERVFHEKPELTDQQADLIFEVRPDDQKKDTYEIETEGLSGTISSNTWIGLLNGFYRWLEEHGVRFVRPGKDREVILEDPDPDRKIFLKVEPAYDHRGVCIEGADSYENLIDFIDWLPKIGMNSFFIQFENPYPFFKRWYEHEFNPYMEKEPFSPEFAQKLSDRTDQEMEKRGIVHHRVGHGWTGEVLGYSSKYGWEKGLELPEDKKEFAAMLKGERDLVEGAPILTSLCFSNPEVQKRMVDVIVDYARNHPEVDYLHVWLSDARNNICECEECQKDLVSDQYIRILNQLDEALSAEGIDTKICFLLYHELLFAPKKEKIQNPDRYTMMFAPITRTFERSYVDVDLDELPEPAEYVRNQIVLPNSLEENLACLKSWQENFDGDSFVYDYPLGRAHYGDLGYMAIADTIYRDIQSLDRLSLNGCISCQELRAGFPHNFPDYVMAKMLVNPNQNLDDLKEEYFSALYGKDWKEAVNYLESLSENSSCDHFNAIGKRVNPKMEKKYRKAQSIAKEALPLIEKNCSELSGEQKEEWKQLGWHRTYVEKLAGALEQIAYGNPEKADVLWHDFLDFIRRNENEIQRNLDVYRVIEVAKNYAGFVL